MTRLALEVDASANQEQVETLVRDLQDRADPIADEAEVLAEGHQITVTLTGASEEAAEALTTPPPSLAIALGTEFVADDAPEDCADATPVDGFACDAVGSMHEVTDLVVLDPLQRVEETTEHIGIDLTLGANAEVLAALSGDAACRRDRGDFTNLLLVLDNEILFSAALSPGVECGVGIVGGKMQMSLGADATPDEAQSLVAELRRAGLPQYRIATVEQLRPEG